jgi:GTP-binding protein
LSLQQEAKKEKAKVDINLAIIGRPNVGKSTLLNQVIGENRSIVSEEAGTTRDIIDITTNFKGKNLKIVDTAGIRRKGKVERGSIEDYSVLRSYRALRECDIAILVIDSVEGLVAKDVNILGQAKEWGKGILLAVNKIDLSEKDRKTFMSEILAVLQEKLNFTPWLPVVFISAKEGENVKALLTQVLKVDESRHTIIPQEDLDEILAYAKNSNMQLQNLSSLKQKKTNPPIFEIKFKGKRLVHYTQIRYLENKIRDAYPMPGSPIFIDLY